MVRWSRSLVLAALTAAIVAAASANAAGPRVIRFVEAEQPQFDRFVDLNRNNRPDAGDMFMSTSYLYKWQGAKRGGMIGTADVYCIIATENAGHCTGTFFLPGGSIQGSTFIHFSNRTVTVPILGGTGAYDGARGEFTSKTIGPQDSNISSDVIRLLPPAAA